jgi:hypothetical protein
VAPVVAGSFIVYWTADGGIDLGKTLLVNALIWGGVVLVVVVLRALVQAGSSSSKPAAKPSGPVDRAAAETVAGPRLKGTVSLADPAEHEPSERLIAAVDGGATASGPAGPGGDVPKLRMSMGRGAARATVGAPVHRPSHAPAATCAVCSTVLPAATAPCPACGSGGP